MAAVDGREILQGVPAKLWSWRCLRRALDSCLDGKSCMASNRGRVQRTTGDRQGITALHCTVMHSSTIIYCTVLHCTVLHCTEPY